MKKSHIYKQTMMGAVACLAIFAVGCQPASDTKHAAADKTSQAAQQSFFTISDDGTLVRPVDYRTWVYVGTPLTPNDMNNGKAAFQEFHNVYIDPVSYAHYKKTGTWREDTILMKELVSVGGKAAVSGNGYFMGDFIGLEATIKSAKHFPNEPGNWAYYSFTNHDTGILAADSKPFASESCNLCHEGSAQDDFVFTQHYPVLSAAKGVGGATPENSARRTTLKKPPSAVTAVDPKADKDSPWVATVPTPQHTNSDVPVQLDALFDYLSSRRYRDFKYQEAKNHPSAGPHTKLGLPVRVFYNDAISSSIKAGNKEHPKGAAIVKEMFDKDNNPSGWAVMVKTHDKSGGGKGWFWYEVTSDTDSKALAAFGNGVRGCQSCHTVGLDMVRSNTDIIR